MHQKSRVVVDDDDENKDVYDDDGDVVVDSLHCFFLHFQILCVLCSAPFVQCSMRGSAGVRAVV